MVSKCKVVSFTFPADLHQELRQFVGGGEMSQFVVDAVREKIAKEKSMLTQAYQSAETESSVLETTLKQFDALQKGVAKKK